MDLQRNIRDDELCILIIITTTLNRCFNLCLNQLTCANNLRRRLSPSQSPRGSSCASSVCRYDSDSPALSSWSCTDYACGFSGCCKSSAHCWLIHLCMCNMFCKAHCLGVTHCYSVVRLPRAPRALNNQNTVYCVEEVKQAWSSFVLACTALTWAEWLWVVQWRQHENHLFSKC